ncbi:MAG: DUF4339 domain-containing protein [Myxococcales bacterium]|nr:DUF4339 domain-containing protein [Myxococcales bacterium]
MRIVCESCGAKYQISDDKVRNKVFKIRCKKCPHTIVVRPKSEGEAGEEVTRVVSAPIAEALASGESGGGDAVWYVVVNREQMGPFAPFEVERRYRAGEIDADTFTWAEGMADWIRLAQVTEFSHLFPVASAPPGNAAPKAAPKAARGGMFPSDEGDDDVMVSSHEPPTSSEQLFNDGDDRSANARVDSQKLRGQRNENSVLFSLDSLAMSAGAPRVSNTGGTDGSGLIDISGLMGGNRSGGLVADGFGGPMGLSPSAPSALGSQPLPSLVMRRKSPIPMIAAISVGVIVLVGGAIFATIMVMNKDKRDGFAAAPPASLAPATMVVGSPAPQGSSAAVAPSSAPAPDSVAVLGSQAPGSEPPVQGGAAAQAAAPRVASQVNGRPRTAAGAKTGGAEDEPREGAASPQAPAAPRTEAPRPPKKSGGDEVDDLLGSLDGGGKKPSGGRGSPEPADSGDPLLPEQLSKQQIVTVMKKAAGSVSGCKDRQPDYTGLVPIKLKIDKSGKVSDAKSTGAASGQPVGNCVESVVRTLTFPQFSGDSMSITFPFSL